VEGVTGQHCWAKGEGSALDWLGKEQDGRAEEQSKPKGKNGKQREKAMGRLEKN